MHEKVYEIIAEHKGEIIPTYRGYRFVRGKPFKMSVAFRFKTNATPDLAARDIISALELARDRPHPGVTVPHALGISTFESHYKEEGKPVSFPTLVLFGNHTKTRTFLAKLKAHAMEMGRKDKG